jgi:hypothetical protein
MANVTRYDPFPEMIRLRQTDTVTVSPSAGNGK